MKVRLMDGVGFAPTASDLQNRRSTELNYPPFSFCACAHTGSLGTAPSSRGRQPRILTFILRSQRGVARIALAHVLSQRTMLLVHYTPLIPPDRFELPSRDPKSPMIDHYTTGV